MLKIGITGGIGSGKTTACKVFEVLGIPVFYADIVAKSIMLTDNILKENLIEAFGPETYFPDGQLNRTYISKIVFNDETQLRLLNSIVHPAVFRSFDQWVLLQQNVPYVLKEAALLFESGSYKMSDYNILVISPEPLKIQRIIERDHITEAEVRLRMDKQLSDKQKEKLADFILYNDEEQLMLTQILNLHEQLIALNPVTA
ncbi:dephospho-CoA kinase [Daejeonella oryzae]|uniref:dephospho-CoA kinase n=1 Tax=Daejeonella oryzae TaxID=1122943 RepID=UPI00042291D6|nr:dephospho-CoA kinase [Daejeonella oryzae]